MVPGNTREKHPPDNLQQPFSLAAMGPDQSFGVPPAGKDGQKDIA
jgi:hypothetical protein